MLVKAFLVKDAIRGTAFGNLAVHHEERFRQFGSHADFELARARLQAYTVLIDIGKAFFLVALPDEELQVVRGAKMVAEHRILAVVRHRHLAKERVCAGIRHHDLDKHKRIHRVLALLEIAFIREEGLRSVDYLWTLDLENLLAVAFLQQQIVSREGHAVVEEREVARVVRLFHFLERVDQSRVGMRQVSEVRADVARNYRHVVLRLETLAERLVVVEDGADRAESDKKIAALALHVKGRVLHHDIELVVVVAEILRQVVVFDSDFQLGADFGLPDVQLATHILERAFHFRIGHVATRKRAKHRDFKGFHVGAARHRRLVAVLVRFRSVHLDNVPRLGFLAKRHKERIVRIARAENGYLELFQVVRQIVDDFFERSFRQ